jgi:hypothetical protein
VSALVLVVLLALVAGAVVLLVGLGSAVVGAGPAPAGPAVAQAARRHETVVSVTAVLVSAAATLAVLMAPTMPLSTGDAPRSPVFALAAATAPYLAAVLFCLVRALGELTWPRPRGAVRTAVLARRTLRDTGGWRLTVLAATVGTGLLAVLGYGVTATPDGQRVGSVVTAGDGSVVSWGSAGPYPGWHYGVPITAGLVAVTAAVLLSLRAVTRRPPLPHVPAEHDDAVRRVAAARVLAGAQLWTGVGVGLTMLLAALALRGSDHLAGAAVSGLTGAALVLGSTVLAATAAPGPRARAARGGRAVLGGEPA